MFIRIHDLENQGLYSNPTQYYDFLQNRVMIVFRPKFDESDDDHPEFRLVLSKKQLDAMPEDQRKIVEETGDLAAKALTKSIRSADSKSFERLKKKMEAHDPTDAEKAAWKEIYKKACQRMKGADFPAEMLAKIKAC